MAKNATTRKKPAKNEPSTPSTKEWTKLTWDDLEEWAGSQTVARGKSYQKEGRVSGLCLSDAGGLLAWVQGTERYVTTVELDVTRRKRADRIDSECTCPVGFECKHGVAVLLELLAMLEKGQTPPVARENDPRWDFLDEESGDNEDFEGWWDEDEFEFDEEEYDDDRSPRSNWSGSASRSAPVSKKAITDEEIRTHLTAKSKDELIRLIVQISQREPDVRKALADEVALAGGRFGELIQKARAELQALTSEDAWSNPWTDDGHLPDYLGLKKRLRTLLEHGHADAVVELGQELMQRGVAQIERSHDEGETACEIAECLEVVWQAVLKSTHKDEDKILRAIDMLLADEFDLCEGIGVVLDKPWKQATWSLVADRLRERLKRQPQTSKRQENWPQHYRREHLSGHVIQALDRAGRSDEATQLCVEEANQAGSYTRAVRRLMAEKQWTRAEQLAREGIAATDPRYGGIIRDLQNFLSEMAAKNKDYKLPAAIASDRFFCEPSLNSYQVLIAAARKAKCENAVKEAALLFLETGERPDHPGGSKNSPSKWPLPEPPRGPEPPAKSSRIRTREAPYYEVLIDLAIREKRPDDVLKWFDEKNASKKQSGPLWQRGVKRADARIAQAVEAAHPDRAIAIYQELANSLALQTNTKIYPEAVDYLKRIKPLLKKSGRSGDWSGILDTFRTKHGRKRRLMEVLDGIEGRPILKGRKK